MANVRGMFVPTYIGFSGKTYKQQAEDILAEVERYHLKDYQKIGIIYSANRDQVETQIKPTYQAGGWRTGVGGGNQAAVMAAVEQLLGTPRYQHLQKKFQILPITTCAHAGGYGSVNQRWLEDDINRIEIFLQPPINGVVLGWQNEAANNFTQNKYAIGGSISTQLQAIIPGFNLSQDEYVQEKLAEFAKDYPKLDTHEEPQEPTKPNQRPIQRPINTPPPPKRYKGKDFGTLSGTIFGSMLGAIPFILIMTGVILIPFTAGGTIALIAAGAAVILGGTLGGLIGYSIGDRFDKVPSGSVPPQPSSPARLHRQFKGHTPIPPSSENELSESPAKEKSKNPTTTSEPNTTHTPKPPRRF
jgi:hypothetical protein